MFCFNVTLLYTYRSNFSAMKKTKQPSNYRAYKGNPSLFKKLNLNVKTKHRHFPKTKTEAKSQNYSIVIEDSSDLGGSSWVASA